MDDSRGTPGLVRSSRVNGSQIHAIFFSRWYDHSVLDDAFAAMNKAGVQALILLTDSIFFSQRKRTIDLASKYKLPSMYFFEVFVEDGGLMSYGPSDADLFRRAAGYVDRILKGAKPGELPVEQPTKFDLYINLRTAKELGLDIPFQLQQRADGLIE